MNPRVAADGLDAQWTGRLGQRAEWLRNNARGGTE